MIAFKIKPTKQQNLIETYLPYVSNWVDTYCWVKKADSQYKRNLILGKLGEVIVSYDLFSFDKLNWSIYDSFDKGDGGSDLSYGGRKIDVKTCQFEKEPLLKEFPKAAKGDYDESALYCLVYINLKEKDYEIVGYISKKDFFLKENLVNNWKGKGPRYIVGSEKLERYIDGFL